MLKDIVWFSEVDKNDKDLVGGKGANLGELFKLKIPIPNGFIVTSQVYFDHVKSSGVKDRIRGILFGLDVNDPEGLQQKAMQCQQEIKSIDLDAKFTKSLVSYYKKLTSSRNPYIAVRSSATAEDLPEASFAGQQATFLNIKGENELKKALLDAWASLFEARAIFYRQEKGYDHFKVGIAVPVQRMIQSEISGVMFTVDPISEDKNKLIIEAVFGLGELIVSGQATPDHYQINKKSLEITKKAITAQKNQLIKTTKGNKMVSVSIFHRQEQKLPDTKIIELAKIGEKIEKHYFFPQDIEWAYENESVYIVQTRPITTISKEKKLLPKLEKKTFSNIKPLVKGAPASPVIAYGTVVIVKNPKEIARVKKGDVLVTQMTSPDFVPAMKKASAIVTDRGGRTSHAAIVSRELGIACVVGTENATKILKPKLTVTVDGARGYVYKGNLLKGQKEIKITEKGDRNKYNKTATQLFVNVADPKLASDIASKSIDGIGLLRAEFILAQIGRHPKDFIANKKENDYINELYSKLLIFARSFGNRPVIYRASDLKSNEYKNLKGGEKFEPAESNPMLGYRGAFRFIKDPDVYKLELEAIKRVRQKYQNLHLMVPFVRNKEELKQVRNLSEESGLFEDPSFKFWMMVEIPSNVILLEDFIAVGIDGISIGSNDLSMLILGTDRDNQEVAQEFNEMDPAVLWALERTIKTARKNNITVSICGQAPSTYPQLTEKLVSWGISSISVNPDAIEETRKIIYQAEHNLLK